MKQQAIQYVPLDVHQATLGGGRCRGQSFVLLSRTRIVEG
jgi:hypothetical protein